MPQEVGEMALGVCVRLCVVAERVQGVEKRGSPLSHPN